MKRFVIILFFVPLFMNCTDGLNKSITQYLSANETKKALRRYPIFEIEYEDIMGLQQWVLDDVLLKQQYDTLTYKSLLEFYSCFPPLKGLKESYQEAYPNVDKYKAQADSILKYYVSIQPDSLIALSFVKKTMRETWLCKIPEYHIRVTPLKGAVEQFEFEYYFSLKINGTKCLAEVPNTLVKRAYQTSPICKEKVIAYLGEIWTDSHIYTTTEELLRDYDFLYRITNVRYNGTNWTDLPYSIQNYAEGKYPYSKDIDKEIIIEDIISKHIDSSYKSFDDYVSDATEALRKEKFPTISALLDLYMSR